MRGPRLVGWVDWQDPDGARSARLAAWAADAGAREALAEGPFRLWCWPGEPVQVMDSGVGVRAIAGVLFGAGPAPDAEVSTLAGHFLCVTWERAARTLHLFRDDSASQDLYYRSLPDGGVLFADDLDLIVTSPGAAPGISRLALHEYLRFLDISTPQTIYAGIRSPEPGGELLFAPGQPPRPAPPRPARPPLVPRGLGPAADAVELRLDAAVRARLPAAGTLISFLSGGIDSALITALAARAAPGRVLAYTVGFEDRDCDESAAAARIARHLGLPHRVLRPTLADYRTVFAEWAGAISHPFADPAALPTLLAYRDARTFGEVALDGTGADELVGIFPAPHRRKAHWLATLLPRTLRRAVARRCTAPGPLAGLAPLFKFDDPEEFVIRWRGWPRRDLARLCAEPVSFAHTRYYRLAREYWPWQHFARYSRLLGSMPDDRIHEASRLTGLMVRFPYFDRELAALVRALPMALRYPPEEPKRILREVLRRHVPPALWDAPKHGFDFPFTALLARDDAALPRHYLAAERLEALERAGAGVDRRLVAATLDEFRAGEREISPFRIWVLTVLSAWIEHHWSRRR